MSKTTENRETLNTSESSFGNASDGVFCGVPDGSAEGVIDNTAGVATDNVTEGATEGAAYESTENSTAQKPKDSALASLGRSVIMCFSLFSSIPMPQVNWEKHNMSFTLAALPLVGLLIGAVQILWALFANWLSFSPVLTGAGLVLIMLLLSGGIHMDGFCDTVDALSAHVPPQRAREIMKDSLTGAFAVIFSAAYLIALWALYTECANQWQTAVGVWFADGEVYGAPGGIVLGVWPLLIFCALVQVFSRALGAFASVSFPSASKNGMQNMFKSSADKSSKIVLICWMLVCAIAGLAMSSLGAAGSAEPLSVVGATHAAVGGMVTPTSMAIIVAVICAFAAGLLQLLHVHSLSKKRFGGMSGDVAGFLITLSQPLMLLVYVIVVKVVELCVLL